MTLLGSPWPDTAEARDGELWIGGRSAESLAREFGDPLYVYCAETLRTRARAYLAAGGDVVTAAKANMAVGVLRVLREEGLGIDISSAGELAAARRAGFEPERIVAHGNAKTDAELDLFVGAGCGLLVIDGPDEPERVAAAARRHGRVQRVLVRVTPGIAAGGHEKIVTGHVGSKFGLAPDQAAACVRRIRELEGLDWVGPHVHLGSQIEDAGQLESVVSLLRAWCLEHGFEPSVVDVGGGLGVAYGSAAAPDPAAFARAVAAETGEAFPRARVLFEPGRSLTATAGVTLYRTVTRKTAGDGTRWVALDAGMADNIRPALYGARYTVCAATKLDVAERETVSLAGRHCESGDVLLTGVELPPLAAGDLVAFATTGAYVQSMASTYNGAVRPAAILIERGAAREITRRETTEELLARDID